MQRMTDVWSLACMLAGAGNLLSYNRAFLLVIRLIVFGLRVQLATSTMHMLRLYLCAAFMRVGARWPAGIAARW